MPIYETEESPTFADLDLTEESGLELQALTAVDTAVKTAEGLLRFIGQRGRGSNNALKCQGMVEDYLLGLGDLRGKVERVKNGDRGAAAEIPGLLRAFKESFNFADLLAGMKGYYKGGEKALAEYVKTTMDTLTQSFEEVCESIWPLCDNFEVESISLDVRNQLNAVADYKFHTSAAKKPVETSVVKVPAHAPVPAENVTRLRGGVLQRIAGVVNKHLPMAAAASLLLALGTSCDTKDPFGTPPPAPVLEAAPPPLAVPVAEPAAPAAPTFTAASDASSLWAAIRGAIQTGCSTLDKKTLEKETGKLVRGSIKAQDAGFTGLVKNMEGQPESGLRLTEVQTDLAKYGVVVAGTFEEVLADKIQTGQVGSYNMDSTLINSYATAALDGYSCPGN